MSVNLKPCPFCGKTPVLSGDKKIRWIVCPPDSTCAGSGMAMGIAADDVDRGIEAWNTRSGADAQAEIARLRGALDGLLTSVTNPEEGEICRRLAVKDAREALK